MGLIQSPSFSRALTWRCFHLKLRTREVKLWLQVTRELPTDLRLKRRPRRHPAHSSVHSISLEPPILFPNGAITAAKNGEPAAGEARLSWQDTLHSSCGKGYGSQGQDTWVHQRQLAGCGSHSQGRPCQGNNSNDVLLEARSTFCNPFHVSVRSVRNGMFSRHRLDTQSSQQVPVLNSQHEATPVPRPVPFSETAGR